MTTTPTTPLPQAICRHCGRPITNGGFFAKRPPDYCGTCRLWQRNYLQRAGYSHNHRTCPRCIATAAARAAKETTT